MTTFIILGTFILLWLPNFCKILTVVFNTELQAYHLKMFDIFICLILLNSVCDPIIYAIRIRHVRKGFLILLSKIAPKCFRHKFTDPQSCLNYRKYNFN